MSLFRIASRLLTSSHSSSLVLHQPRNDVHRWVMPTLTEIRRRRKKLGPQPVARRSDFIDWNYEAELSAFGSRLKEKFSAPLLQQAFVCRSYIVQEEMKQKAVGIENPVLQLEDNMRLVKKGEELITEFVITYLNLSLPKLPREGIKAIYKHLVSDEVLANVSKHIGTKDLILSADHPVTEEDLVLSLKAVIGALFESSGEAKAFEFIRDFIITQLNQADINEFWKIDNNMELLKEICKDKKLQEPELRLINEVGKNTLLAAYQIGVYSDKKLLGHGYGEDVNIASEEAAKDALRTLFQTNTNMKPLNFKMPVEHIMKALSRPSVASVDKM